MTERFGKLALAAPLLAAVCVVAVSSPSCSTTCTGDRPPPILVPFAPPARTNAERTAYESTSWSGKYLEFKPEVTYDFEHHLIGAPSVVQGWIGFGPTPVGEGGTGNISEGVGNELIVEKVTARIVRVRNDTCETFWLRVSAANPLIEGGSGGAGDAVPAAGAAGASANPAAGGAGGSSN